MANLSCGVCLFRPVTMEDEKFEILEDPSQSVWLSGRLWAQVGIFFFFQLRRIPNKKPISRCGLGQYRPKKFSSRFWIRRGVISCSPYTSFDEINDSVVNSGCGKLVRGSDPPLVYSAHSTAGDSWFI